MKVAGILLAAALICAAQTAAPLAATVQVPAPPVPAPAPAPKLDHAAIDALESAFESRLRALDVKDPFDLMSACTGVYVNGYGMVFTLPVVLATTPVPSPFRGPLTKDEMASAHTRKLAHLPMLKKAMREMLLSAFEKLPNLPPNEKIAVAARAYYLPWEDKAGLPDQIVYSADRASALAGNIQTDEQ